MTTQLAQWAFDVSDLELMTRFWSAALGYRVDRNADGSVTLLPADGGSAPTCYLQVVPDPTPGKNRAHPDLRPLDGDVAAEVDRLVGLGARLVDVGQSPDDPFVVLADPEGNEFCVLHQDPRLRRPS